MSYQYVLPGEIEKRSFEILTKELGDRKLLPENEPVIKRVIHTTADFDYVDNLVFSDGAVTKAVEAFKAGAGIVTDTQMALSGIRQLIPFDQMLDAMYAVGKRLPAELRETALGGCAATPAACAACGLCSGN